MKKTLSLVAVALAVFIVSFGCQKTESTGNPESGANNADKKAEEAMATIVVGSTPFTVEIVKGTDEKEKGLSGRESLPEGNGMWFVFDQPGQYQFWMKDTQFPLDMIFVDSNMQVVHIAANAVPNTEEKIIPPVPFLYALEINGGLAAKNNFKIGDAVQMRAGPK